MEKELFQGQSFYEVLGLTQEASTKEVVEAYESKREELDSLEEVDEVVLQRALNLLERAHGTLIDDERRAEYDETLGEVIELEDTDAIKTALREFDTTPAQEAAAQQELTENGGTADPNGKSPRLSGRMKATVTVPLSTITKAIQEGEDLEFANESEGKEPALTKPGTEQQAGVIVDATKNPEGEVSSYDAISQSLEAAKVRSDATQPHVPTPRGRKPSLEIPRSSVAYMTQAGEDEQPQKTFVDYFLIFCAFILPVATVLLTIIHFVLPES